jgi:hypothetical protein
MRIHRTPCARVALELKGIERHYGQGATKLTILKGAISR